jgi:hypothetical protein
MMKHCYIISYDLCKPGRNYDQLYEEIKSFPQWGHLTQSTWAVISSEDSESIRNRIMSVLDSSDRVIVIKSGQEAAWQNLMASNDWAKKNLIL